MITRAQIAQIIADYCAMKGYTVETTTDAEQAPDYDQVPEECQQGVAFCYDAEIMTGNEKGELNPAGELTRAEWAQILCNLDAFAAAQTVEEAA